MINMLFQGHDTMTGEEFAEKIAFEAKPTVQQANEAWIAYNAELVGEDPGYTLLGSGTGPDGAIWLVYAVGKPRQPFCATLMVTVQVTV